MYEEPKYQCPEGFLLGNYKGSLKCVRPRAAVPGPAAAGAGAQQRPG